MGGATCRKTLISWSALDKNLKAGYLFEGNPVYEGKKRRGTDTPMHRPDKTSGSTHSSTLHCPLFPETNGIINKETIARMKDGVIIINNSRGQLIVEQDLADALNSGKVAAAGLDVVSVEPIRGDNPLLQAKNCLITPHISWAPKESRERIMSISLDNLRSYLAGNPINTVNM